MKYIKKGIHTSPEKFKSILEMREPDNTNELETFIGKITFYWRYIKNVADKFRPLYDCVKNSEFIWTKKCKNSFELARKKLASSDVIIKYNPTLPLILACDALPNGLSAVFSYKIGNKQRPIAYRS